MSRLDDLTEHISEHYLVQIEQALGKHGIQQTKILYSHLRSVYKAVAYESINGQLIVLTAAQPNVVSAARTDAIRLNNFEDLTHHNKGTMTIEVVSDHEIYLSLSDFDIANDGDGLLGYSYSPTSGEQLWLNGKRVGSPTPAKYPLFGLHVFRGLQEALQNYARDVALNCECEILASVWREPERIVWKPSPESRMRDSLYWYLKHVLADGIPDPVREAPVDDRNPVDLTIRWADSNRIAVIEVKWLGSSGKLDPVRLTKTWRADRATKGLRQLANYIDLTRARTKRFDARGYLVVFDGRRAKVGQHTTTTTRSRGLFYAYLEPDYDVDILARHDIAPPVRCFCEPNFTVHSPSAGIYVQ